jgi:hypothetical protein
MNGEESEYREAVAVGEGQLLFFSAVFIVLWAAACLEHWLPAVPS